MSTPFKMKGWSPFKKHTAGHMEKSKKHRAYEMYKVHAGKPGFQEYLDKTFGGPTTVKGSTTLTEKNIKSSPVKEQIKGTPIGGGFRDWPKGEEPPKKTKLKEWNPTTQTLEVNKGDISKHLSFNMETGEMKIKKKK